MGVVLLCSCGLRGTAEDYGEGWVFHWIAGHKIREVGCGRKIGPFECCTVVEGDCLELMKQLPDGCVDAVITDPNYGIGADKHQHERGGKQHGNALAPSRDYGDTNWDASPCPPEAIAEIRRVSGQQVIFGGNYFALPPSSCWLVWDKQNGDNGYADCELAWTNLDKAVRRIYHQWHGFIRLGDEERIHPTQKPERVMAWCIEQAGNPDTILDPFCGSGTTLVAAKKLGRHFLGFEISPDYCRIARERIALVEAQPNLFEPKPEQLRIEDVGR